MALTIVITRDVDDRYRGFLASAMLEVGVGVYASPHLGARARDQVWDVMRDWHGQLRRGAITMVFADKQADGGMVVRNLGEPARRPVCLDGALLTLLRVDTRG